MDIYTRFNRKSIDDRQIDTLIGICKGLAADKKVNQTEAEFLMAWLIQSQACSNSPIILNLLDRLSAMLEDGILDEEEAQELLSILQKITGEPSEVGELAKTSMLPVDDPLPPISFEARTFLFTGTCAFGTRKQCHDATQELGGVIANGVSKSLDYLVLGAYVTDSWAHENFGRKIEKAMAYRSQGVPLSIISEEHWANSGDITV